MRDLLLERDLVRERRRLTGDRVLDLRLSLDLERRDSEAVGVTLPRERERLLLGGVLDLLGERCLERELLWEGDLDLRLRPLDRDLDRFVLDLDLLLPFDLDRDLFLEGDFEVSFSAAAEMSFEASLTFFMVSSSSSSSSSGFCGFIIFTLEC